MLTVAYGVVEMDFYVAGGSGLSLETIDCIPWVTNTDEMWGLESEYPLYDLLREYGGVEEEIFSWFFAVGHMIGKISYLSILLPDTNNNSDDKYDKKNF